ncbi:hypothetical protein MJD09_09485, partial [bacterium]|nr:hypothetical protein [bacterium]
IKILISLILLESNLGIAQNKASSARHDSIDYKITAKEILKGETPEQREQAARKQSLIDNVAIKHSELTRDGVIFELSPDSAYSPKLSLTPEELRQVVPTGPDPLGDELRRRFADVPPTVSLNRFIENLVEGIKSSLKKVEKKELRIPTDLQIDILKVLWDQTLATGSEIYASLDPSWPLTSEDMPKILEKMEDEGLLARRKLSPSHEFGLFGLAKIELSSKNRKNQQYLYWPVVPKDRLIRFIDAKRYLAYSANQNQSTNGGTAPIYKNLEEKLFRLLR